MGGSHRARTSGSFRSRLSRRAGATCAVALATVATMAAVGADGAAAARATRYSLVHGCYALRGAQTGMAATCAEHVRMQPTTLGRYLLYRPDR